MVGLAYMIKILPSLLIFASSAFGADPIVESEVHLTPSEIQECLDIEAWRVEIPKSYGKHPQLVYEQLVGGKRVLISECSTRLSDNSRRVLITLRPEKGQYVIKVQHDNGAITNTVPSVLKNEKGLLTNYYIETQSLTKQEAGRINLKRWEYKSNGKPARPDQKASVGTAVAHQVLYILPSKELANP